MDKFGLIGKTLKHSYSKIIHGLIGDYPYDLYEIEPDKLKEFTRSGTLKGFNVTIPYKKEIMPYLDKIDQSAQIIGAVNTVVNNNGYLIGYNTDFKGMIYMIRRAGIDVLGKKVMILGSGGTSTTALSVVKYLGASHTLVVSRSGYVNYDNYLEFNDADIIINTTPVGMYPNNYDCPIDLTTFNNLKGVIDVIYNPNMTMLTLKAKEKGVPYTNGLPMLVAQAKYAYEYFFSAKIGDGVIDEVLSKMEKDTLNVVLVGMAGSGKSTIGEMVAKQLGREFIDTDKLIEKRENRDTPSIFKDSGEEYFRQVESAVLKEVGCLTGKVIATGGGVVKNAENYPSLKANGKIFWIDRNPKTLALDGRPLSKDKQTAIELYKEREPKYRAFSDVIIENNADIQSAVQGVVTNL